MLVDLIFHFSFYVLCSFENKGNKCVITTIGVILQPSILHTIYFAVLRVLHNMSTKTPRYYSSLCVPFMSLVYAFKNIIEFRYKQFS